jgi:hypothetical protein
LSSKLLAASAVVLALISLPVAADQTEELARLREEAAALRQSLNRLDARIQAFESQGQNPAPSNNVEPSQPPLAPPTPLAAPAPLAPAAPLAAPAPLAPAASLQPIVTLKQNWSQVERGIAQQKVQSLLGQPEKVMRIDGNTVWLYTYPGIGRGSVFFRDDGIVSSAQSPSFGWGW